jgi:hypothetical protein
VTDLARGAAAAGRIMSQQAGRPLAEAGDAVT